MKQVHKNTKVTIRLGDVYSDWVVRYEASRRNKYKRYASCVCVCGTIAEISIFALRGGGSTRCKRCSDTSNRARVKDSFGDWTVLSEASPRSNSRYLLCRCKCGRVEERCLYPLRSGRSTKCKSCVDLERQSDVEVGTSFGDWVVVGEGSRKYVSNRRSMLCRCKCGTLKEVILRDLENSISTQCWKCTSSQKGSIPELELQDWVSEGLNLKVQRNDRTVLGGKKELDLYIPNLSLAVEYNGNYWHSSAKINKWYHWDKRLLSLSKGVRLIQIRSDEWANKRDIVQSMVQQVVGSTNIKYSARNLVFRSVNNKKANYFLEKNHLMGGFTCGRSVGLFTSAGELVQILTYKLLNSKTTLECSRICSKIGVMVVGGVSKLIKNAVRLWAGLEEVVSFVDLRYATGHSLIKLGFHVASTTLGFCWTRGTRVFNRLQCRANMDERKLTQAQHAEELGWAKLWDAGQAKFVLAL